jgi:ABC-2 type transport system ATP-binding protein
LIEISHLYKSYGGKVVLDDVSLSVGRGAILGLLGPNGAGKTTLLSILTGIVAKDRGEVTVSGLNLDRELGRIQSLSSYVPQAQAFYLRLTVRENLEYFGSLWGLKGRALKDRMEFCIDAGSMQAFADKRVDRLSGGMKRRLNLAIGLLNEPEVLFLDEPTVGVDAQSRSYILETIGKINREKGTTVVYTSHYMDEIEQVSDAIAVIDHGKIILHGDKKTLLASVEGVFLSVEPLDEAAIHELRSIAGVEADRQGVRLTRDGRFNETMAALFGVFHRRGMTVKDGISGHGSLEGLFLKLTSRSLRDDE